MKATNEGRQTSKKQIYTWPCHINRLCMHCGQPASWMWGSVVWRKLIFSICCCRGISHAKWVNIPVWKGGPEAHTCGLGCGQDCFRWKVSCQWQKLMNECVWTLAFTVELFVFVTWFESVSQASFVLCVRHWKTILFMMFPLPERSSIYFLLWT